MATKKAIGLHRLTVQHTGARTPSSLDYKTYTVFYDDGTEEKINQSAFEQNYKGSGLTLYGGTVTRPFHSFNGTDVDEAKKLIEAEYKVASAQAETPTGTAHPALTR